MANSPASVSSLFKPVQLGALALSHRVVLAPLTRNRNTVDGVPTALAVDYYQQRASRGGLLVTEATTISKRAQAYPLTPGIFTTEQIAAWRKVTDAVHAKKGLIVTQLWHTGRVSHSSYSGPLPQAPSAVPPTDGNATTYAGSKPYEVPHALTIDEISEVVAEFRHAAKSAREAGFDGIELHAANGYLIEQFISPKSNTRTDKYGGSDENRARFLFEILDAVKQEFPTQRIGVRLSPAGTFGDIFHPTPLATYTHIIDRLNTYPLAYVHLIEPRETPAELVAKTPELRRDNGITHLLHELAALSTNSVIAASGFESDSAAGAVNDHKFAAVAFGRHFIANPDLPLRLLLGAELNPYDRSTFYGGNAHGYTDYPFLTEAQLDQGIATLVGNALPRAQPLGDKLTALRDGTFAQSAAALLEPALAL